MIHVFGDLALHWTHPVALHLFTNDALGAIASLVTIQHHLGAFGTSILDQFLNKLTPTLPSCPETQETWKS